MLLTAADCVHLAAGDISYMSSGSAPISQEVFEFLRICFGSTVTEGYGMTETTCTITIQRPDDATIGHVGAPVTCNEVETQYVAAGSFFTL